MISGQKRNRDEVHTLNESNFTLKDLCIGLKPLNLSTSASWIRIKEIPFEGVDSRTALYTKPKCIVHLEDAPDGLPHLLLVDRTIKISSVIENHLCANLESLRDSMGEEFCNHISSLERALHSKSAKTNILDQYFVPEIPVNRIMGPTVLARLLNGKSPRQKLLESAQLSQQVSSQRSSIFYPSTDYYSHSPAYCPASPSVSPAYAPIHTSQMEDKEGQLAKRAWLEKQSSGVFLAIDIGVPESKTNLEGSYQEIRRCYCYRRRMPTLPEDLSNQLIPFLREDLSSIGSHSIHKDIKASNITVDIRRILLGFSLAARTIETSYHKHGKAHCDLTPTNILVLEDTFLPIDSMDIPMGSVAPGGTLEWSAPEQILYRPVSDKTDVYSLALMIVALLGGIMFGQISEYVVASRPQNLGLKEYSLNIVKIIAEPELTLGLFETEHENSALALPIDEIRNTLRKCLQLDPLQRPTILELSESLVKYAMLISPGPECVLAMNGFGDGDLCSWLNEEGVEEYFWKTSYNKNRI